MNKVHVVGVGLTKFENPDKQQRRRLGLPGHGRRIGCHGTHGRPSAGSAPAILASEAFFDEHTLFGQAMQIIGQAMTIDFETTFDRTAQKLAGYDTNVRPTRTIYDQTRLGPGDFQAIELHVTAYPRDEHQGPKSRGHQVTKSRARENSRGTHPSRT